MIIATITILQVHDQNTATISNGILMTGHVELTLTDKAGNIKKYIQTDNVIVDNGENCAAKILFIGAGQTTTGACTGVITEPFTTIALGRGTGSVAETNSDLDIQILGNGLDATVGYVAFTNSSGGIPGKVIIMHTFTSNSTSDIPVTETGLFNGTDINSNGMFARQFTNPANPTQGLIVSDGDSITIRWTISYGQ